MRPLRLVFSLILLLLLLAALPAGAAPQHSGENDDLETYIRSYMQRNRIPGAALVITENSNIVYANGFGAAGPGRAMTPDTPMFIGSQTKSLTALAVMQLVEAGLVDLDAPVREYIPWFRVDDPAASEGITLRSLLNHTSGLSETGYVPRLPEGAALEEAVRDLQRAQPAAAVGETFQYFNPGYIALGYLVEVASGQDYALYLREHIFDPLGMAHTSADPDAFPAMEIAQGYSQLFAFPVPMDQAVPRFYLPAGFVVSTAADMARYLMAMERGGELDGARVLSESGVRQMFLPNLRIDSTAGFGWDIARYYGEPQITHGGATERFNTHVLILPQRGLTAVLLINQDHMFKATYDYEPFFWGAVDLVTGHPVTWQRISSITIGYGILAVFSLILFLTGRGILGLGRETVIQRDLPVGRKWLRVLPHLCWIVFTLVLVIFVGPAQAGRAFDLRWFTGFYPDVALLAIVVLLGEGIQAVYKGAVAIAAPRSPGLVFQEISQAG